MEYKLNAGGKSLLVSVHLDGENRLSALIDGHTYQVACVQAEADTLLLSVDGRQVRAGVAAAGEEAQVVINGTAYVVFDEAMGEQRGGRRKKRGQVPDTVTPPMPAVVVRVLVNVGDTVKAGQAVAVVSAMKMETTLKAPFDGTVVAVHAATGDKVAPGDILVDIEKTGENPTDKEPA